MLIIRPTNSKGLALSLLLGLTTVAPAQLLNEILVNPNGVDANCEYIELRGTAGASLTDIYFVSVEGDNTSNPGVADVVFNLSAFNLGTNGLLVITAADTGLPCGNRFYHAPPTTQFSTSVLDTGALESGANSWLLISSNSSLTQGFDYDSNNDGTLDLLPVSASIVDGIGWQSNGDVNDVVYGSALLPAILGVTPDAAVRFPGNDNANSAVAWYYGDMEGFAESLEFDQTQVSTNFPVDGVLTPGQGNVDIEVIFNNGFEALVSLTFSATGELDQLTFLQDAELSYRVQEFYAGLINDKPAYIQLRVLKKAVQYRMRFADQKRLRALKDTQWQVIDIDNIIGEYRLP
ncbi:hypothetical protein [Marinicella sp. W31]|uniref:hypothetical protein n=1 Tax=Marinicella sp. W31 TaxID=3023713 RepID=UPI0037563128